jgi:hypothetical protein
MLQKKESVFSLFSLNLDWNCKAVTEPGAADPDRVLVQAVYDLLAIATGDDYVCFSKHGQMPADGRLGKSNLFHDLVHRHLFGRQQHDDPEASRITESLESLAVCFSVHSASEHFMLTVTTISSLYTRLRCHKQIIFRVFDPIVTGHYTVLS